MKRIIAGILSGVLVVTSLAACSSNAYVKTQDKEGNGKIKGVSADKQYTAVLDMSGLARISGLGRSSTILKTIKSAQTGKWL